MEPGEGAEDVGLRSSCSRRYAPGRDLVQPLATEVAHFPLQIETFVNVSLSKCCSPPSRDATGGRASTSSIGTSAGIFSCGQPLGVQERTTEGEREGGGAEAIDPEEAKWSLRKRGSHLFDE